MTGLLLVAILAPVVASIANLIGGVAPRRPRR